MKKIIVIYLIVLTLLSIFLYKNVISLTSDLFHNFLNNIIPSLLPLVFLLNLLIEFNVFEKILVKNNFLKEFSLILICILLGAPANMIILQKLEEKSLITKEKKYQLVSSFATFSFSYLCYLFIYGNKKNNYFIMLIILTVELFNYLINIKIENTNIVPQKLNVSKSSFQKSMIISLKTLMFIFFTTLLMNMVFIFNLNVYKKLPYLIMPYEFSYAGTYVKNLSFNYKSLVLLIITSMSSISIFLQLIYVDKNYNLLNHLKKRTLIAIVSIGLFFIFFL